MSVTVSISLFTPTLTLPLSVYPGRNVVNGPKLSVEILADPNKPVKMEVVYKENSTIIAGDDLQGNFLPACLPTCLPVCLLIYLPDCPSACLPVCLPNCVTACLS